ncbi:MAG: hypothetical protein N3E39_03955 [Candidatus Methanomethylicia archaeon]|nr:hypothetical protein [Candidatus Methanomethylicia archaeon]
MSLLTLTMISIIRYFMKNKENMEKITTIKKHLKEEMYFETFVSKFMDNLKIGMSPERALLISTKKYEYNKKMNLYNLYTITLQNMISGVTIKELLKNMCNVFSTKNNKRILLLLSSALSFNSKFFSLIAYEVLNYIKKNINLKNHVESLLSRMRIRVIILSISSAAIYSFLSKILVFVLIMVTRQENVYMLSTITFFSFLIITTYNTYIVSKAVFCTYPIILTVVSSLIFGFLYVILPNTFILGI